MKHVQQSTDTPLVTSTALSRRGLLTGGGLLAASVIAPGALFSQKGASVTRSHSSSSERRVVSTDVNPVVETSYGKIRGSIRNGICAFKGVPYGTDTGGANRWMAAREPKPWAGVLSRTCNTYTCPTTPRAGWSHDEERFIYDWSDGVPGEDMLVLNVWTPGVNDNRKRPVLVWIHGGGYAGGSNEELPSYDGERLARRGDIVVIGVNHRLNILGFLNLERFGEQYKNSQNQSQLDLVLALNWIKTNVAAFGGDAGAVTIFGQSGGGGKVTYLMGMPSAVGLFHRCIMESPSQPRPFTQENSIAYSDRVLKELGVNGPGDLKKLHDMPYHQLMAGMQAAGRTGSAPPGEPTPQPAAPGRAINQRAFIRPPVGFQPSTGEVIPELPFYPHAPAMSASVPVISGAMLNEFTNGIGNPGAEKMTREQVIAAINHDIPGGRGADIYAATERLKLPGRGVPFDIWGQLGGISAFRRNTVDICSTRAAASGQAPAYNYQFRWQTPTFDGRPRAFHCAGLQFAFDNVERCANGTGGGPDAQAVADVMSEAWIAFIRTGNPNRSGLPRWDAVAPGKVNTMVFDNHSGQETNFDANVIEMLG